MPPHVEHGHVLAAVVLGRASGGEGQLQAALLAMFRGGKWTGDGTSLAG